jgi:hypothetical protein
MQPLNEMTHIISYKDIGKSYISLDNVEGIVKENIQLSEELLRCYRELETISEKVLK